MDKEKRTKETLGADLLVPARASGCGWIYNLQYMLGVRFYFILLLFPSNSESFAQMGFTGPIHHHDFASSFLMPKPADRSIVSKPFLLCPTLYGVSHLHNKASSCIFISYILPIQYESRYFFFFSFSNI